MPRQRHRLATLRRHDVDVGVPWYLAAERNRLAIGKKRGFDV